ncbi:site-2 protease family protein [Candidatus Parcubacteria bacterium]|nr:site-2 protease family protein [Patescibacteria group bacterium]MBU4466899.1 site-2 protease family protein [Patescibacteria group bacterium]MCG2688278.1 site-2 protease family protein [Candidatus Parcubacteria bacterium]
MFLTVFLAFISLIILISIHELGHFLTAKKFGVEVEEFGFGYPPRLFGRKFGNTLYSINLLPFGAFVRISEKDRNDPNSFLAKPLWQRMLIIFNGAFSFWIVAIILFSIVFAIGAPTMIEDSEMNIPDTKVLITSISANSPAASADLRAGDVIVSLVSETAELNGDQVGQIQDFIIANQGKEIILIIKRGDRIFNTTAIPRISPPAGEGSLGIGLARVGLKTQPVYLSVFEGFKATLNMTRVVITAYIDAIVNIFKKTPTGLQLSGPIGIVGLLSQGMRMGTSYFLQMIGLLSINVAIINLLPIPAFDGGKLMFLTIEAIRKKPIPQKIEEKVTTVFFVLLIIMMVFVTIKDIKNFRGFF